jgi:hypothetical protein
MSATAADVAEADRLYRSAVLRSWISRCEAPSSPDALRDMAAQLRPYIAGAIAAGAAPDEAALTEAIRSAAAFWGDAEEETPCPDDVWSRWVGTHPA